ncbi:MAG: PAS domain S-box protein [Leptolyngbyaceae cyanobacterium]
MFCLLQGIGLPALQWSLIFLNSVALLGLIARFAAIIRQASASQHNLSDDYQTRLQRAQALAHWGDWEFDTITQQVRCSPALMRILGRDDNQPNPTLDTIFQQVSTHERDLVQTQVRQSLLHNQPFTLDASIARSESDIRRVTCCGEAIYDHKGKVIGCAGVVQDITAAPRQPLADQTSPSQLQSILENACAAIFSLRAERDRTLVVDYASAGVETIYGYAPKVFSADPSLWLACLHDDDRQPLLTTLFETIEAHEHTQLEFRIHPQTGGTRWLTSTVTSHHDQGQDCWRLTMVTIDISEQRHCEIERQQTAMAKRQQALLRQVLDSIPHQVFVKDVSGRFLLANQTAAAVHGTTPEQLIGHHETDFNPHLDSAWLTEILTTNRAIIDKQETCTLPDAQLTGHTGETRWYQIHLTPYRGLDGSIGGIIGHALDFTEHKHLELALRASREQYQTLVNSINGVVWEADPETFQFTFVSPQAESLLGYPLADWLTPHFWVDHVCAEDVDTAIAYCQKSLQARVDHQFEYRMQAANGDIVWIEDIVKLVYDGSRLVKLVGLLLDVTDRKQAETDLWKSQQLLQRVVDSVPQAIFWKDCQSIYLGCNQNFADYAGLRSPTAITGKTDHDLPWTVEEATSYQNIDREVIASGQPQLHAIEPQHIASGNVIWVETSKVPLTDAAGNVIGILGTYEDITQRRATKQALEESEARFRAVFEQTMVGIALFNCQGKFLRVNTTYAAVTGYSSEELMLMDCSSLTHPDDRVAAQQAIASLIAREKDSCSMEKRYLCKGGEQKWVNIILCPVIERDSENIKFLTAVIIDITDRKRIAQALHQRTAQEQMFSRVMETIRSSLELETIFSTTVREAFGFLDICRVSIAQYFPERQGWKQLVEHRCRPHFASKLEWQIPDQDNPFTEQLGRGNIIRVNSTEDIAEPNNQAIAQQFPGSWLLIPVMVNGELWGSLNLQRDVLIDPAFSDQQVKLMQRLADQLAIAIQQSTLYERLKAANQQLQYLAMHDSLTQLDNRRSFEAYLGREWSRLVRSQEEVWISLILCDIDYFKQYNDLYGHIQGDACLTQVAQTLMQSVQRPTDMVARYGGEEFAIILPETNEAGAVHIVQQIQMAIADLELQHAGSQVASQITFSFGIACMLRRPAGTNTDVSLPPLANFIDIADQALYQAKVGGRNRYQVVSTVL